MLLLRLLCFRTFLFTNYIYYLLTYLLTISLINLPSISKQFANVCSKYPVKNCLHAHKIPWHCYFTWKIWRKVFILKFFSEQQPLSPVDVTQYAKSFGVIHHWKQQQSLYWMKGPNLYMFQAQMCWLVQKLVDKNIKLSTFSVILLNNKLQ